MRPSQYTVHSEPFEAIGLAPKTSRNSVRSMSGTGSSSWWPNCSMPTYMCGIWSTEDAVLQPLYGLTGIDPAANELVGRQRADRRSEMERLALNLQRQGLLARGTGRRRAVAVLLILTSYETFRELRADGFSDRQAVALLRESGSALLLRPA